MRAAYEVSQRLCGKHDWLMFPGFQHSFFWGWEQGGKILGGKSFGGWEQGGISPLIGKKAKNFVPYGRSRMIIASVFWLLKDGLDAQTHPLTSQNSFNLYEPSATYLFHAPI